MGGPRILSDAQVQSMAEVRERGWTHRMIARHFTTRGTPISEGSIAWQCLRVGADLPPARRKKPNADPRPMQRGGHTVRPFTEAEDAQLLELERSGTSIANIGRKMDRRHNSVRARLMILARRDARAEETAQ